MTEIDGEALGADEMGPLELTATDDETGALELGAAELGATELGALELGIAETEKGALELGATELGTELGAEEGSVLDSSSQ